MQSCVTHLLAATHWVGERERGEAVAAGLAATAAAGGWQLCQGRGGKGFLLGSLKAQRPVPREGGHSSYQLPAGISKCLTWKTRQSGEPRELVLGTETGQLRTKILREGEHLGSSEVRGQPLRGRTGVGV